MGGSDIGMSCQIIIDTDAYCIGTALDELSLLTARQWKTIPERPNHWYQGVIITILSQTDITTREHTTPRYQWHQPYILGIELAVYWLAYMIKFVTSHCMSHQVCAWLAGLVTVSTWRQLCPYWSIILKAAQMTMFTFTPCSSPSHLTNPPPQGFYLKSPSKMAFCKWRNQKTLWYVNKKGMRKKNQDNLKSDLGLRLFSISARKNNKHPGL